MGLARPSYGESSLYTLSCVSLQATKKPAQCRPVSFLPGDIRRDTKLSAARSSDILRGSYRVSPQSPASSQTAPLRRSIIIQHSPVCVKHFLKKISSDFYRRYPSVFGHNIWTKTRSPPTIRRGPVHLPKISQNSFTYFI